MSDSSSDASEESERSTNENWPEKRVLRLSSDDESTHGKTATAAGNKPANVKKATKDVAKKGLKNPPFVDMIVEAIQEVGEARKGASAAAIKARMMANHDILEASMKTHFKKQILKGIENGTLIRPAKSKESKGLNGRFKVHPDAIKANKRKETKKNKPVTAAKSSKMKSSGPKINTDRLTSLKSSSTVAKVAREKIKRARRSVGISKPSKPKPAVKKVAPASKKVARKRTGKTTDQPKSKVKKASKAVAKRSPDKPSKPGKAKPKMETKKKSTTKTKK